MPDPQILTAEQMRGAEQRLFDAGMPVFDLMLKAAGGAAEWIRRIAAGRAVTVLCGPGNNGGDGYVIAARLREAGNRVEVIAPVEPKTDAAREARALWDGPVRTSGGRVEGDVFVDCLFGSGLSRPLSGEHVLLLRDLSSRHHLSIAIDVPSGIESDTGALLNEKIPDFDVTLALGAWKFAHCLLPGRAKMGRQRLVPIGVEAVEDAAQRIGRPSLSAPTLDSHKYRRGLAMVVGGEMPGAAKLSALAAMRAGAGYVKLASQIVTDAPPDLVVDRSDVAGALGDDRINAVLVGPGLGRSGDARAKIATTLRSGRSTVIDADALHLLEAGMLQDGQRVLATPHDGELDALCRSFSVIAEGRLDRAKALAAASKMVICAKGPDTIVAAPDGRIAIAPPAPSWLAVAGSGDVLAGIAVSRMASGCDAFEAACDAVWLHGEAARICGPMLTPLDLVSSLPMAVAKCL